MDLQTATDYGPYLANEASPLYTSTIVDKCTQKLVDDWNAMRCQVGTLAVHPVDAINTQGALQNSAIALYFASIIVVRIVTRSELHL